MYMHPRLIAVLLACAAAFTAAAADVDLIVQFKQPARMAMTATAIESRREALAARLMDLRDDVGRASARHLDNGGLKPALHIRQTYHRVLFGAAVRVPREMRQAISELPYVASVHEEQVYRLSSWDNSVSHINATQVWSQLGTRGAGVTIAVIDSGIDYRHAAFGGGLGSGFKVIGGWDFAENDSDPLDTLGHGTHVAGIIAANGPGFLGVAPDASLLAYRVFSGESGSGAAVLAAIERAVADDADVINLSLGGPAHDNDPTAAAVENAIAAGIVVCIAAGNGGDYGNVQAPGIAPSAITVGASDANENVAGFSSRGPSLIYAIKPEILAPGAQIRSAAAGGHAIAMSGTSMATPHVAGVAALVKALHHDWSPADVKSAIVTTATLRDDDVMISGAGRVDALAATTVATLASPAVASFGRIDPAQAVWSQTRTLTLRNVSTQAQTLTATVRGLRDGVALTVTPAEVTLAPGASASVEVRLAVTNAAVPAPQEGSLSFGGRIEWSGGTVPVHVPWAFVKGTLLAIEASGAEREGIAEVLGVNRKHTTGYFHGFTRVLWPMEKVDVVVVEAARFGAPASNRVVVVEQVDTAATSHVVARMADAQFTITTDTTDEKGGPLKTAERSCKDQLILAFPQGRKFLWEQQPFLPAVLFGPFSERIKLYVGHHCADIATNTLYTSAHEPHAGLQGSFTSTLRPQWFRHEVHFEGDGRGYLTVASPALRFPAPQSSFYLSRGGDLLMRPTSSQLTIYSARGFVQDVDLVTVLSRYSMCNRVVMGGEETTCQEIGDVFAYLGEQETRIDGDLYPDPSPMAYRAPAGSPLTLTAGPLWPQVILIDEPTFYRAFARWGGPKNEPRNFEAAPLPVTTMRNAAGAPVGFWSSYGDVNGLTALPPGAYRIDSAHSNQVIAGIPAKTSAVAIFDTRRTDGQHPQFTGLRVVDEGERHASVLRPNAAASLIFSVADVLGDARVPPREEATRVEYRAHGTSEWHSLTPLVEARQYPGVGTMYRVDLSTVTRNLTGPVDLRLRAEDAEGNTIETTIEPALVVSKGGPRRRGVRH